MKTLAIISACLAVTLALSLAIFRWAVLTPEFLLSNATARLAAAPSLRFEVSTTVSSAAPPLITWFSEQKIVTARRLATGTLTVDLSGVADLTSLSGMSGEASLSADVRRPGNENETLFGKTRWFSNQVLIALEQHAHDGRTDRFPVPNRWFILPSGRIPVAAFTALDPQRETAIRRLAAQTPFLIADGNVSFDPASGKDLPSASWRMPVHINAPALKAFLPQAHRILYGRDMTAAERAQEEELLRTVSGAHGELALHWRTLEVLRLTLDAPKRFQLSLTATDYGKPVLVESPQDTIATGDFLTLWQRLLTSSLSLSGSATSTAGGAQAAFGSLQPASSTATSTPQGDDADHDGLPDSLEGFYGSDSRNPDTDGDGVTDGAEVDAGTDPIGTGRLYEFRGGATTTP